MYKVVKDFTDLKDNNHVYLAGDIYPRKGVTVSEERVAELAGADNKRGTALIKAVNRQRTAKISDISDENKAHEQLDSKPKKRRKKQNKKEK